MKFIKQTIVFIICISLVLCLPADVVTNAQTSVDVVFSHEAGMYTSEFDLELRSTAPGKIYYTLNNSEPSPSKVGNGTYEYTKPIHIRNNSSDLNVYASKSVFGSSFKLSESKTVPKCMIVKAMAVTGSGASQVTSDIETSTFIVDAEGMGKYNLPIISLSTEPDNLYGEQNGLFVNRALQDSSVREDIEKVVNFEYFDENGVRQLNQKVGVRLQGDSTKSLNQKTLRLYAREEYDPDHKKMKYEFFPWKRDVDGNHITSYKRILLRNSGNDFGSTMVRDAFNQWAVRDLNVDYQDYRPAACYVLGEFYGLVNIRDRYDNRYCENNYKVDPNDVVMIKNPNTGGGELEEGEAADRNDFVTMHKYISSHDLEDSNNYEYANSKIDLDCMMDYFMMNNFIANTDWPVKNARIWRSKQAEPESGVRGRDGRWRYMIFDTDISTDMWQDPLKAAEYDAFEFILDDKTGFTSYKVLYQNLMTSTKFRKMFLDKYVRHINTTYNYGRLEEIMNGFRNNISKIMPYFQLRNGTGGNYSNAMNSLLKYYKARPEHVLNQISEKYNYGSQVDFKLFNAQNERGTVTLDEYEVIPSMLVGSDSTNEGADFSGKYFNGKYFKNISITLRADAKSGSKFVKWIIEKNGKRTENTQRKLVYTFDGNDVKIAPQYAQDTQASPTPTPTPTATPKPSVKPSPTPTATPKPSVKPSTKPTPASSTLPIAEYNLEYACDFERNENFFSSFYGDMPSVNIISGGADGTSHALAVKGDWATCRSFPDITLQPDTVYLINLKVKGAAYIGTVILPDDSRIQMYEYPGASSIEDWKSEGYVFKTGSNVSGERQFELRFQTGTDTFMIDEIKIFSQKKEVVTPNPSLSPTATVKPTPTPSNTPVVAPSTLPSAKPTPTPSNTPVVAPSVIPSIEVSADASIDSGYTPTPRPIKKKPKLKLKLKKRKIRANGGVIRGKCSAKRYKIRLKYKLKKNNKIKVIKRRFKKKKFKIRYPKLVKGSKVILRAFKKGYRKSKKIRKRVK